jgi:hypothetical protein
MDKRIKALLAVVMAAVMAFAATSCSLGKSDEQQAGEAVENMLSMLKQYKLDKLEDYVVDWSDDDIDISSGTGIQKSVADKMMKAVFRNLDYEVTDIDKKNSKTIYVTAKVKNVIMGPVLKNWITYLGSLSLEHSDYNQTRLMKEGVDNFVRLIDQAADDRSFTEKSVKFKVVKSGRKWKVGELSHDDIDAIMGGFLSFSEVN